MMGLEDEIKKDEGDNNEENENNGENIEKKGKISEEAWDENEGFLNKLNPEQIARLYIEADKESKGFYETYIAKQAQERAGEIRKYIEKENLMRD